MPFFFSPKSKGLPFSVGPMEVIEGASSYSSTTTTTTTTTTMIGSLL